MAANSQKIKPQVFIDAPGAAKLTGLSERHFRKRAAEEKIIPIEIKRRRYVWLRSDIEHLRRKRKVA